MPDTITENVKPSSIESRFFRYLIDIKYALRESDFDDGVNIGEESSSEKESKSEDRFQRILLEVEQKRLQRDEQKKQALSNTISAMAKSLRPHIIKHVQTAISDNDHVIESLLRLPKNFCDLVDMLYSPAITFSRVASIVKLNHVHDSNLIRMINRHDFQTQIGKPMNRRIKDTQMGISVLGLEGAKALLPVMMVKQTIKLGNDYFPLLGFKLWKLALTNGLATHHILKMNGYPDPIEGLLAGMLIHLGKISIYHQFVTSFDEVQKQFLMQFRREGKKSQHDLLLQVEPDGSILFQLMEALADRHSLKLIQHLELHRFRPKDFSVSLQQALSNCAIEQCSPLAKAIRQGYAFATLEQLRHVKLINNNENLAPYLNNVGLSKEQMGDMLKLNLTRLNLKEFVEQ